MRPQFADRPPQDGNIRPKRMPGIPPQEQEPLASVRPPTGPMNNQGADQPLDDWRRQPSFFNSPPTRASDPMAGISRPLSREAQVEPPPGYEIVRPTIPLGRFGRATGLSLKLRFLLALTLLSLAPAFLLVLLYQQANQASLTQAGQQILFATAQTDAYALTQELAQRQAHLARLAQQIAQISQGSSSSQIHGQTENLLNEASLSTADALAWVVLSGNDQIVAATPPSLEEQALATIHPAGLETFVHAQRAAPAPKSGQAPLVVASGEDSAISSKVWVAELAFVSPATPTQSGAILAVFSLPALVQAYLSTFSSSNTSYTALFDAQGVVLGVANNHQLEQQQGQMLAVAPLQDALHSLQSGQDLSTNAPIYHDPTTGAQEQVAGTFIKTLGWICLVVASPNDLAPSSTGLLSSRNIPLIFLSIIVVTTLVATWVALPIVRPIRRATREILASTNDVRLLSDQAKQIAKDQRLGTDILEGAAKGLDLRRRAIGRDATLIASSTSAAAARLTQLAYTINKLPEAFQAPMQVLTREIYQEMQSSHQLATGISSGLESDPAQKRLGNVMEGAAEISQQFDLASQQLQHGAGRLERAAEALQ